WAVRRLGRPRPASAHPPLEAPPENALVALEPPPVAAASPYMVLTKTEHLRGLLAAEPIVAEQVLRPLLETEQTKELCQFLRHFGPEPLQPLRRKPQFAAKLGKLSDAY